MIENLEKDLENLPNQVDALAEQAFQEFDTDKSGVLERSEVSEVLKIVHSKFDGKGVPPLSEEMLDEFLKEFDTDGSGTLSKTEFTRLTLIIFTALLKREIERLKK